ncbi:hypothetical protein FHR90_003475 [Endobacter medicaginis]|uniref:GIY-YIG nuclease family protein n=1 Tax=Endobacter medicaginis TaxID=1181271 RepID=A0A850NYR0_9PROT|nr:GIY-YIG nuclease family protein [Endobacter medicaginis]MBB3175613.1 hypothetical protein [Endobacter medicaginis]MCX5476874.1 GIY-YIG nuclease family protein [Endobacter medicaginis]NVN31878.1 GIY-YIG nuclease family protein [Endobacter medicaginis]
MQTDTLLDLGFIDVGAWRLGDDGKIYLHLDEEKRSESRVLLDMEKALYSFAGPDGEVLYIGKTARAIRQRFNGYRTPGGRQRTNIRCNAAIRERLNSGQETRVLVFPMTLHLSHLRYGDFPINIAAGLEDGLIEAFNPPWNKSGGRGAPALTEDAEREVDDAEPAELAPVPTDAEESAATTDGVPFTVELGDTYLSKGHLNLGRFASPHLGENGEVIKVILGRPDKFIISKINRTANRTGNVRLVGNHRHIADWLRERYVLGDTLHCRVLDRNTVLLQEPRNR